MHQTRKQQQRSASYARKKRNLVSSGVRVLTLADIDVFGVRLLHGSRETTRFVPAPACLLFALRIGAFVLRDKVL